MMMDRYIKYALILLVIFISKTTIASENNYQGEGGFHYSTINFADDNHTSSVSTYFSYKHYLESIAINNNPLAETGYLERISDIYINYGITEDDADDSTGETNELEFIYTHTNKQSPLWLQFSYYQADYSYKNKPGQSEFKFSYDQSHTSIAAGYYLDQTTLVDVKYLAGSTVYTPATFSSNDYDVTQLDIEVKHLIKQQGAIIANIEASYGTRDYSYSDSSQTDTSNTVIFVTGDYYFTNRHSAGASYKTISGDDNYRLGTKTGIHGKFYLNNKISLSAELAQFSKSGKSTSYDLMTISAFMRF